MISGLQGFGSQVSPANYAEVDEHHKEGATKPLLYGLIPTGEYKPGFLLIISASIHASKGCITANGAN